jgi:hypothetical protein
MVFMLVVSIVVLSASLAVTFVDRGAKLPESAGVTNGAPFSSRFSTSRLGCFRRMSCEPGFCRPATKMPNGRIGFDYVRWDFCVVGLCQLESTTPERPPRSAARGAGRGGPEGARSAGCLCRPG